MNSGLRFSPVYMIGDAQVALGSLVKVTFNKDGEEKTYQGRIVLFDRNKGAIQLDCSEKYHSIYHYILVHTIVSLQVIQK